MTVYDDFIRLLKVVSPDVAEGLPASSEIVITEYKSYDHCKTRTEMKEPQFKTKEAFFEGVNYNKAKPVDVIDIVGSPCDSLINNVRGNTTCYCIPRGFYCY